jgi:hypothetical protein
LHFLVLFKPHETVAVIAGRKPLVLLPLVLENTLLKVAGNADLEGMAAAGHHVNEIAVLPHPAIVEQESTIRL